MNIDYKKIAVKELIEKSLESTRDCFRYLELKRTFTENDKCDLIYFSKGDLAVSFPVLSKKIFILVFINTKINLVDEVVIRSTNIVKLVAVSRTYTIKELNDLTGLAATGGWSKEEIMGTRKMDFTSFVVKINKHSFSTISENTSTLLDYIENNRVPVLKLIKLSDKCLIKIVSWNFYKEVDGFLLSNSIIRKITSFNLGLSFEPYLVE